MDIVYICPGVRGADAGAWLASTNSRVGVFHSNLSGA